MASVHTHCRRELFHSCWSIMLDEDFISAYRHGIVLKCADGVARRIFPRIFTYSADYPEKCVLLRFSFSRKTNYSSFYRVLIATIKDMGLCPCPRCLTPKSMFSSLGLAGDMKRRLINLRSYTMTKIVQARNFIYGCGNTVDGVKVEYSLGEGSWVPIIVSETVFLPSSAHTSNYRINLPRSLDLSASIRFGCSSLTLCTSVN
jgi:hypothetical protein